MAASLSPSDDRICDCRIVSYYPFWRNRPVSPGHQFERLPAAHLHQVAATGRSSCVLSVAKLQRMGITVRPIDQALAAALASTRSLASTDTSRHQRIPDIATVTSHNGPTASRRERQRLRRPPGVFDATSQLRTSKAAGGTTTYRFHANGNQQIVAEPSGNRSTCTWDHENQNTLVHLSDSSRVTMTSNSDSHRTRKDPQ